MTGVVLYGTQFCFMMGLKLTNSATQTAIIQQCIPVFTAAITVAIKMEKFSLIKLVGLVFSIAGAIVMIGFKDLSLENSRTIGMFMLLGNTSLMATYYVLQKPLLAKYPPITVTGCAYVVASFAMGLTSLFYINVPSVYKLPKQVLWPLSYAIFIQTIFGFCCVSWANSRAPASMVAVYNCVQPIVAFILAYIFFHEIFVWTEGVGVVLVIAGLAFVTWARSRENKKQNGEAEEKTTLLPHTVGATTLVVNSDEMPTTK